MSLKYLHINGAIALHQTNDSILKMSLVKTGILMVQFHFIGWSRSSPREFIFGNFWPNNLLSLFLN